MHILIVDDKVPDPIFGAGFPRAYRLLLSLIELGHRVSFLPTSPQDSGNLSHETLKSFNIFVIEHPKDAVDVDVAILSRPHNVHYHMPVVKKFHPNAKLIYDTEALWYRRYDLQLEVTGRLPWWAYRYDELGLARAVDLCFVVNHEEKGILEANGVKKVNVLGHALDAHKGGQSFENRKGFLVVGGILEVDSSNEDALWWYLENAWTEVQRQTGATLKVTGHRHTDRLLNNHFPCVELMGLVDDLVPCYEQHVAFIASTRFATGIPWKVHEAMAHGCPCIISGLLARQLGVTDGVEALVANSPQEFIEKSVALYTDKGLWDRIRQNAYGLIARDCDPEKFKRIIEASLSALFA